MTPPKTMMPIFTRMFLMTPPKTMLQLFCKPVKSETCMTILLWCILLMLVYFCTYLLYTCVYPFCVKHPFSVKQPFCGRHPFCVNVSHSSKNYAANNLHMYIQFVLYCIICLFLHMFILHMHNIYIYKHQTFHCGIHTLWGCSVSLSSQNGLFFLWVPIQTLWMFLTPAKPPRRFLNTGTLVWTLKWLTIKW